MATAALCGSFVTTLTAARALAAATVPPFPLLVTLLLPMRMLLVLAALVPMPVAVVVAITFLIVRRTSVLLVALRYSLCFDRILPTCRSLVLTTAIVIACGGGRRCSDPRAREVVGISAAALQPVLRCDA